MKNLKNFAFGLLVAVLAVGFSSFTSAKEKVSKAPFLVQVTDGVWEQRSNEPGPSDCLGDADRHCYYEISSTIEMKDQYDADDIEDYLSNSQITQGTNSSLGLYNP